jgi:hypothetical protein
MDARGGQSKMEVCSTNENTQELEQRGEKKNMTAVSSRLLRVRGWQTKAQARTMAS